MTRTNYSPNPSCKNDATGWFGNATYARSSTLVGMPSGRTTGVLVSVTAGGRWIDTPIVPCVPGETFSVSFDIGNFSGGAIGSGRLILVGYTRDSGLGDTFPVPDRWNTVALGADGNTFRTSNLLTTGAPANATGMYLELDEFGTAGFAAGAVLVERTGTVGSYADGDTPGWQWNGANGNSTSSETTTADSTWFRPTFPPQLLEQFAITRAQAFQESRVAVTVTGLAVAALGASAGTVIGTPTVLGVTPAALGNLTGTAIGTPFTPDHTEARPTPPLHLVQRFAAARALAFQPSRTAITVTGLAVANLRAAAATVVGTPTVLGVAAAALGSLTGTGVVNAGAVTGVATAALNRATATALGTATAPGIVAAPLGRVTATAIGRRTTSGTGSAALGRVAAGSSGAAPGVGLIGNVHGPLPVATGAVIVHTGTIAGAVT